MRCSRITNAFRRFRGTTPMSVLQQARLEQARTELDELQSESAGLIEEHAALRAELAGLDERRRSEKAAETRFETQLRDIAARREELAREMERLGVSRRPARPPKSGRD